MKAWLFIIGVLTSFSIWAIGGPVVTVFSSDIQLPPECKVNVRPSVLDSQVYYSCSEMSVRFKRAENIDIEYLKNQDIIEGVTQEHVGQKEHYLIETRYGDGPQYVYVVCDNELCMSVTSINIDAIKNVVLQLGSELLHNKALENDAQ